MLTRTQVLALASPCVAVLPALLVCAIAEKAWTWIRTR